MNSELWQEFEPLVRKFYECMNDDFNFAGACASMREMVNCLNRFADKHNLDAIGNQRCKTANVILKK